MQADPTFAVWMPPSIRQANIPLAVRSVGRYMINPQWRENAKKKWFHELFWVVEGEGKFLLDDKWVIAKEGDLFRYKPGDLHDARARSKLWTYCWIT